MKNLIEVLPNIQALVEKAVELTIPKIHAAIEARGLCTIALAGGSTPKPVYEALATRSLPWDKIHIFWGDERYVPPDSSESNQRMARHTWLDQVNFPESNIHAMPTQGGNPVEDAKRYEAHLQEFFQVKEGEFPSLDLVFLGIGDDAHTASLFPHTDALKVRDRLITVGNKDDNSRLTFTADFINQARCVMFLIAGESKRSALEHIFAETGDEFHYPARLIQPQGELWWLLDAAASPKMNNQ